MQTSDHPSHPEQQYLDLVRRTIESGARRPDRTGTGTLSTFGAMMRFDLSDGTFPLLTTKRVFWKGVVEELLWFLSGSTDAKVLSARGVKIWDANASKEALAARGLHDREEGDLGPVYAFQWRRWGAEYVGCNADYSGQGFDQLADCVRRIKEDPSDRRIVMSAWNVSDLSKMALPPCHMICQFYVADGKLSCLMYQRSADLGLGVPFNIASYALLTCLVAQVCGLERGEFIHTLGDAHVYLNHVNPLLEQLQREPKPFPKLRLNELVTDIDAFKAEDVVLEEYHPHPPIKMDMCV